MKLFFLPVAFAIATILSCAYAASEPAKGMCKLLKHPSVEYKCIEGEGGTRSCSESEPDGTVVRPECRAPNYYYSGVLPFMRCIDGTWDYVATCLPECGTVSPSGEGLRLRRSTPARRGEVPWHASVYTKTTKPYRKLCEGTLVSKNVVLSVAHCFWDDVNKLKPAQEFAVAVGKLYRPWDSKEDQEAQKSDVSSIKIPPRFYGRATNFQDDISVITLATDVTFSPFVRPVCLDFNTLFELRQLQPYALGKASGWPGTGPNKKPSNVLTVLEMAYIPIEQCLVGSSPDFRPFITGDKICAAFLNGTSVCRGGSGVGLTFPEQDRGVTRYYLRGIASVAPRIDEECSDLSNMTIMFTQISKHEDFIKNFL